MTAAGESSPLRRWLAWVRAPVSAAAWARRPFGQAAARLRLAARPLRSPSREVGPPDSRTRRSSSSHPRLQSAQAPASLDRQSTAAQRPTLAGSPRGVRARRSARRQAAIPSWRAPLSRAPSLLRLGMPLQANNNNNSMTTRRSADPHSPTQRLLHTLPPVRPAPTRLLTRPLRSGRLICAVRCSGRQPPRRRARGRRQLGRPPGERRQHRRQREESAGRVAACFPPPHLAAPLWRGATEARSPVEPSMPKRDVAPASPSTPTRRERAAVPHGRGLEDRP